MEKIKEWLKPLNHKIIVGLGGSAILVISIIAVVLLNQKPNEPTIVFRENIVLEYGQTTETDDSFKLTDPTITIIDPLDLIKVAESEYDEVSLNKILMDGEISTLEFSFIDTMKLGKQKGRLYARLGTEIREFEFEFEVKDTQMPVLEGVKDIKTEYGVIPDFTTLFKASDPVSGVLEVLIHGDVDYNTVGTYSMIAEAMDHNNNKTAQAFTITVTEEVIEPEVEVNDSTTSTNGDSNTAQSNTNGNTNNSTGNNSGSTNTGSGNTGGNIVTPPVTTPPVITPPVTPPVVVPPAEEENPPPSGMLLYHDYGTFQACAAVIDTVADEHWDVWQSSICFDDGTLFYRPN